MIRIALVLLLLLQGCSSAPKRITYYQLSDNDEAPSEHVNLQQNKHLLRLSPVTLRGALNNRAMILRQSESQVYTANYQFWADSPSQLLVSDAQLMLMDDLDDFLVVKGAGIYAEQLQTSFYQLDVDLSRFNGGLNNDGELAGVWRLSRVDATGKLHVLALNKFSYKEPLSEDGYDALAQALGRAWSKALGEIATTLKTYVAKEEKRDSE